MSADSKAQSPAAQQPSGHVAAESAADLPPCRHIKIQLGDPSIVKHTLDEQAAMYILDQGYTEDVTLSNVKIGLGVFSVLLTALAHFYPHILPGVGTWFLKACVVLFFILQGVLQVGHFLVEKDCILVTKKKQPQDEQETTPAAANKKGSNKKNATASSSTATSTPAREQLNLPVYPVSFQASLARYETAYHVSICTRTSEAFFARVPGLSGTKDPHTPEVSVSDSWECTEFFDANGVFLMERFQGRMKALLEKYAQAAATSGKSASRKKKE
jgi:hypothetical protein